MSTPAYLDDSVGWNDGSKSAEVFEALGSSLLGIAPVKFHTTYAPGDLPSTYVGVRTCNALYTVGNPANPNNGGAKMSKTASYRAAVAETIERYCAAFTSAEDLQAADGRSVLLPAFGKPFSEEQYARADFPFIPYQESMESRYVAAYNPLTQKEQLVPAETVFLRDLPQITGKITYATSNGLAAGPSREEAFLSGLLELIERDSIMRMWYLKEKCPKINLQSTPKLRRFADRYLRRTNLEYYALDLSDYNDEMPRVLFLGNYPTSITA